MHAKIRRRRSAPKRPPRPPISQPQRLRKYSDEHLAYEVQQLLLAAGCGQVQFEGPGAPFGEFLNNARVEAFALHLRNLIVFLYPERFPLQRDDISAHHFLSSRSAFPDWIRHRPGLSPALARAKRRADREIAHLTAARIAGTRQAKNWQITDLVRELAKVLAVFLDRADPERLGARARAEIGQAIALATAAGSPEAT